MLFGTAKRLTATVPLEIFIDNRLINFVKGYKYLGTWLDPCVNMSEHLEKVFKKASSRLRLLSRMRRSLTRAAAETIYKAIILPTILYCSNSVLKVSDTIENRLEHLQERAIRTIYKKTDMSNKECDLMSITNRKKLKAACLIFQCLQGTSITDFNTHINQMNHRYQTRNNNISLRLPRVKTEAARKSFWFQGPFCFNELPLEIRQSKSFLLFKSKLKVHFLNK